MTGRIMAALRRELSFLIEDPVMWWLESLGRPWGRFRCRMMHRHNVWCRGRSDHLPAELRRPFWRRQVEQYLAGEDGTDG